MSFCLRTNTSLFSLLGDKKNLCLGEFDELKSHQFSVHFFYSFLSKKGLIYMQKCGITHQIAMQQEIQEKEDIAIEGAESGGAGMTRLAEWCRNRRGALGRNDLMLRRLDINEESHQGHNHKTPVAT